MFSRETYFFYFIDSFMHCAYHPTHRGRSGAVIGPSTDRCTTPHSHSLCLLISKFTCCPVPVVFSFSLSLSLPLPPPAFFFFLILIFRSLIFPYTKRLSKYIRPPILPIKHIIFGLYGILHSRIPHSFFNFSFSK